MQQQQTELQFVVCLKNDGYKASLEARKIYRVLADEEAAKHRMIRVIDESGEDYLYPEDYFAPISFSQTLIEALAIAVPPE